MPQLTYEQQAFCTPSDIEKKIGSLDIVLQKGEDLLLHAASHIQDTKDDVLKYDVLKECKERFKSTVSAWMSKLRSQIAQRQSQASYDSSLGGGGQIIGGSGFCYYSGGVFAGASATELNHPQIFLNDGTPGSAYANDPLLKNGSVLIDTTNGFAYRNRGNIATPVWTAMNDEDGLDYIFNPSVLKLAQMYAALSSMAQDGLFRSRMDYNNAPEKEFMDAAIKRFDRAYNVQLYGELTEDGKKRLSKGNLTLLHFDISGDGVINEEELLTTEAFCPFAGG